MLRVDHLLAATLLAAATVVGETAATAAAATRTPATAQPASAATPWTLTLAAGRTAPTTLTLRNRCLTAQRFEATKGEDMPWFGWSAGTTAEVGPSSEVTLPVEIDTRTLVPGLYEGRVDVRCPGCVRDPTCSQDHEAFRVRLRVPWEEATLSQLRPEELVPGELLAVFELPAERRAARDALLRVGQSAGVELAREVELPGAGYRLAIFTVRSGTTPVAALLALQQASEVLWAQPSFRYRTLDAASAETASEPRADPLAQLQYAPRLLRASDAVLPRGAPPVRLVIVDSGVDLAHPDLAGAVLRQVSFLPGRKVEPHAHGTAMVGIVAARARNGIGIAGLAPLAEVLLAHSCAAPDSATPAAACTTESVVRGLDFALSEGARVVSLSLGGPRDPLVARLCSELFRRGVFVVAAAGNDGPQGEPSYPAALADVVAVAALDAREALYPASTRGDYVDLAAPGVEVLTTAPGGRYLPATGTSAAAAHVAAIAAMALQVRPQLRARELAALLEATARDLGQPGRDREFGAGVPDAAALLARLRETAPP